MAFQLTFAGAQIQLEDPDVLSWVEARLPLSFLRETCPLPCWPGKNIQCLAFPQWPSRPPLRIGDYYYPTGLSRWSEIHLLVTETQVGVIQAACFSHSGSAGTGSVAKPFVMRADAGPNAAFTEIAPGVTTNLYMLPPRTLSQVTGGKYDGLYLLSLVDQRYFLHSPCSPLHPDDTWSWSSLITTLCTDIGISVSVPAISGAYGGPDFDSGFWANGEDVTLLLDAAAWNCGLVFVRNLNGTYRLVPIASETDSDANRFSVLLAGGGMFDDLDSSDLVQNAEAVLPQAVIVTFPRYLQHYGYLDVLHKTIPWHRSAYPDVWQEQVNLADLTDFAAYKGNENIQVFRDTAKAFFVNVGDSTPANQGALQTLARQIATDYLSHQIIGADEVYPAIRNFAPENIHDIIWTYRRGMASTRIQRKPWNFGVSELQHSLGLASGVSYGANAGPAIEVVRVATGATPDSHGKYDAFVQRWNSNTQTWAANAEEVWLLDPNGGTLSASSLYGGCRWIGFADGRKVYAAGQAITGTLTTGTGIMVEDDRGLPPAVNVTTEIFHPWYAHEVLQPNANQASIRRLWEAWGTSGGGPFLGQQDVWRMIFSNAFTVTPGAAGVVAVDANPVVMANPLTVQDASGAPPVLQTTLIQAEPTNTWAVRQIALHQAGIRRLFEVWQTGLIEADIWKVIFSSAFTVTAGAAGVVNVDIAVPPAPLTVQDASGAPPVVNTVLLQFEPTYCYHVRAIAAGQAGVERLFEVWTTAKIQDHVYKLVFSPSNTWSIVALADGSAGISRVFIATGYNGTGVADVADVWHLVFNTNDFIVGNLAEGVNDGQVSVNTRGGTANINYCDGDGTIHQVQFVDGLFKQRI
jgi:hypothetical protein